MNSIASLRSSLQNRTRSVWLPLLRRCLSSPRLGLTRSVLVSSVAFSTVLSISVFTIASPARMRNALIPINSKTVSEFGQASDALKMFDIGFGGRTFNFQLGRETQSRYLGSDALQQAIQLAQLRPLTMVSGDFNGDGMGDWVIGYANGGGGVLSFRQGNVQAIAPTGEVFQGITQGRYPEPFLHEAKLYELPEAPDFLQVGDFNSDGYEDVLAAALGGANLYLLAGDGKGTLQAPQRFELSGQLTA